MLMMESKYCEVSSQQLEKYMSKLHTRVHWLLIYKEEDYQLLDEYFSSLLFKIGGLNSLLGEPWELLDLLSVLEAARLENNKSDCDFKLYRKAILDAHAIIDKYVDTIKNPTSVQNVNN